VSRVESTTQEAEESADRSWKIAVVAAIAAVGIQLWGLYRVVGPPSPPWFPQADKVEHAAGFALPVALILIALWLHGRATDQPFPRTAILVVAAVFGAHAVVSELIQYFFYRTRTGDPRDALADAVGICLGVGVFLLIRYRVERRRPA
jgi:VanZ family protein